MIDATNELSGFLKGATLQDSTNYKSYRQSIPRVSKLNQGVAVDGYCPAVHAVKRNHPGSGQHKGFQIGTAVSDMQERLIAVIERRYVHILRDEGRILTAPVNADRCAMFCRNVIAVRPNLIYQLKCIDGIEIYASSF